MELLPKDMGRVAPRLQWNAVATTGSLEQCMDTVCIMGVRVRGSSETGKKVDFARIFSSGFVGGIHLN